MPDNLPNLITIIESGGTLTVLVLALVLLLKGEVVARPVVRELAETKAALQTIAETSREAIQSFRGDIEQVQAGAAVAGEELRRSLGELTASNKQVYRLFDRKAEQSEKIAEQNQRIVEQNRQVLEQNERVLAQNQQVLRQNQLVQQQLLDRSSHPELIRRPA